MANQRARVLRKNMTQAERALWSRINRRQISGAKFRRQQPLGTYVVDFVCFENRLIIEVDGGQHNTQIASDKQRAAWLESQGFRVLRFWNNDVLANMDGVLHAILKEVRVDVE